MLISSCSLAELYFWARMFHHTPNYTSISLGGMNSLVGYYGPSLIKPNYFAILRDNQTYPMLLLMAMMAILLILARLFLTPDSPLPMDLAFNFFSLCFGQTRNRYYTKLCSLILIATCSFLAYFLWSFNCATLIGLLTVKNERFRDYSALNSSNMVVYMSEAAIAKYRNIPSLTRYVNFKCKLWLINYSAKFIAFETLRLSDRQNCGTLFTTIAPGRHSYLRT